MIGAATAALDARPDLEENFYWRGGARYMLGDRPGAIGDFREALKVTPVSTTRVPRWQIWAPHPEAELR